MNYEPSIIRETSGGYSFVSVDTDMFENREIGIFGEICEDMANRITSQIRYLTRKDPKAEITLYINSCGGEVNSGMAIYDAMRLSSAPVRTVCTGVAASMASLLFTAGDARDIYPHSRVMIHDPLISNTGGSALRLKNICDSLMETRDLIAEIIAEHSKRTVEEILELTAADTWFNAKSAVEFGLADRILTFAEKRNTTDRGVAKAPRKS